MFVRCPVPAPRAVPERGGSVGIGGAGERVGGRVAAQGCCRRGSRNVELTGSHTVPTQVPRALQMIRGPRYGPQLRGQAVASWFAGSGERKRDGLEGSLFCQVIAVETYIPMTS